MKKIIPFLVFLLLYIGTHAQRAALASEQDLLVEFAEGVDAPSFLQKSHLDKTLGLSVKKALSPRFGFYLLEMENPDKLEGAIEILNQFPEVISAQPNRKVQFRSTEPDDPMWPEQWGFQRTGFPDVWDVSIGGTTALGDEIVVAVLDSGFDLAHPDLQGNLWENPGEVNGTPGVDDDGDDLVDNVTGWNFVNNSPFLSGGTHGTNVMGIVGARGDNGTAIAGGNWQVKLMPLVISFASDVVEAFQYAIDQRGLYEATNGERGAFVVVTNGSFGFDQVFCEAQPAWASMYDKMGEAGILSVAAVSNENWDIEEVGDMPGTCTSEYLINVTAINRDDEFARLAYGANTVDLAAPTRVPSLTTNGGVNAEFAGNSAACPHVASAIALLYSLPCTDLADLAKSDPPGAAALVRDAVLENVELLSSLQGKTVTGGLLDVYESMKYLHAYCIAKVDERAKGDFKPDFIEQKEILYIAPNPAFDKMNIVYGNDGFGEISIRIFNSIGQEMMDKKVVMNVPFEPQTIEVDVKNWSSGTYVVSIAGAEKSTSLRFVKI